MSGAPTEIPWAAGAGAADPRAPPAKRARSAAAAAPAAAAAAAAAGGERSSLDPEPYESPPSNQPLTAHVSPRIADLAHAYEPAELADLVLVCGPARARVAAHRAYLLRTSRLFARLLADLGPAARELVVTEPLAELRRLLLDLIYEPASRIAPGDALAVLAVADKYEAPALIAAARRVLADEATPLALPAAGFLGGGGAGGVDLLDALAAAARHGFPDVCARCEARLRADAAAGGASAARALAAVVARSDGMGEDELRAALRAVAGGARAAIARLEAAAAAAAATARRTEPELAKARADLKSLGVRYNRLIAAAGAAGVEPPDGRAKKTARGGRRRGAAAGAAGAAAAAAAADAAADAAIDAALEAAAAAAEAAAGE
jgi:hypothetical protein